MLVARDQVAWPSATPIAVAIPAGRPPTSVLRIVRAVSGPGVTRTTIASATKPARSFTRLVGAGRGPLAHPAHPHRALHDARRRRSLSGRARRGHRLRHRASAWHFPFRHGLLAGAEK